MKVLLIDDMAVNRRLLRILAERAGHTCFEAEGADDAEKVFAENPADVAFVDLHMPGKDGVECARTLRALPGGDAVKLVVFSGDDTSKAMATGLFDGALSKPVGWADMEKTLPKERT